jgi:hypothetical protein
VAATAAPGLPVAQAQLAHLQCSREVRQRGTVVGTTERQKADVHREACTASMPAVTAGDLAGGKFAVARITCM